MPAARRAQPDRRARLWRLHLPLDDVSNLAQRDGEKTYETRNNGADPSTWGPSAQPVQRVREEVEYGGNPSTWGPAHQPKKVAYEEPRKKQVETDGADPSTWGPSAQTREKKEKKAPAEDCDKLGNEAAKCRGERNAQDRIDKERREREWRYQQNESYR